MNRFIAGICCLGLSAPLVCGCRGGYSSIERPKGQIEMRQAEPPELKPIRLNPATASQSKEGVDVTIRYASPEELEKFFEDKKIFGPLAGKNPYPPHTMVFFIKVANFSGKKIYVNPETFVLIDNLNIQYSELSPDNISSLYESKSSIWSFARTTGDLAPGPYGAPFKVASAMGAGSGRKQHYLIKQVRLAAGYIFPGIAYDGYVAFPRSHPSTSSIRLLIHNLKTDFNAADEPANAIHFEFPFGVEQPPAQTSAPTPDPAPHKAS